MRRGPTPSLRCPSCGACSPRIVRTTAGGRGRARTPGRCCRATRSDRRTRDDSGVGPSIGYLRTTFQHRARARASGAAASIPTHLQALRTSVHPAGAERAQLRSGSQRLRGGAADARTPGSSHVPGERCRSRHSAADRTRPSRFDPCERDPIRRADPRSVRCRVLGAWNRQVGRSVRRVRTPHSTRDAGASRFRGSRELEVCVISIASSASGPHSVDLARGAWGIDRAHHLVERAEDLIVAPLDPRELASVFARKPGALIR